MLKPFLLLAIVFIFGVQLRAQYPDEPPMNPIFPTEYQYHFWKFQLKYSPYFQGHQSEISLPRNHNSNHEYKSRDCDLILKDMKLLVTPKQKGNCWIFQFDKKAKKNVDSISIFVLPFPKPRISWGHQTNVFFNGARNILSPNGNKLRIYMLLEPNNKYRVLAWNIQIGDEKFEFDNDSIPEFITYKIYSQNSAVVNCPVEISCESKNSGIIRINDTLDFQNLYSTNNFKTSKIHVIEKNDSNYEALFNINNSLRLMSLIRSNFFPSAGFIRPHTVKRNQHVYGYYFKYSILGNDSDMPLVDINGDDSMDVNFNYVYPPREQILYDLDDITHILIICENKANTENSVSNKRIVFAKKYLNSEKFELVFSINQEELLATITGTTVLKVPQNRLHLIWDENLEIVKTLKACRDNYFKEQGVQNNAQNKFCSFRLIFPGFNELSNAWVNQTLIDEYYVISQMRYNYPFWDNFYYENYAIINNFIEQEYEFFLDEFSILNENQAQINWHFLVNEYGEPLPLTEENKQQVLRNPNNIYYAFSKNVNAYQVMQYNDSRDSLITKHMFFTVDYKGFEIPYLLFTLPETSDFNFIRNFNAIPLSQLPWKIELEKALSHSKVYDPNNKADLQELDALFYLDSFEGKPLNMLNVCLGCSEH